MSYNYIRVPDTITFESCQANNFVFAPSKYSRFLPTNSELFVPLSSKCIERKDKIKVNRRLTYSYSEIGDIDVNNGTVGFRTSYGLNLPSENPKKCCPNDILISTVRSYRGGFGMLSSSEENHCCSPAIIVIEDVSPDITKEYLLAILKSDFFIEQILGFQTRGMYPRLDSDAMDNIVIPIPENKSIQYISVLMRAYLNKHELIKQRHADILKLIDDELRNNQKANVFRYNNPNINDLQKVGRLDASLYSVFYQENIFRIINYTNGYAPLTEQKLKLYPGPSLELKLLGTRIDSDKYINGFYRLITPKQITNYGTVKFEQYIGTPAKIKNIKYGDILFGESGTGRTLVYLDNDGNSINNAHAHVLRSELPNDLERIITIRSILQYYKETGLTDCLTVGGSGGHLSPSYFDRLFIPNFPKIKQKEIATLYYNPAEYNANDCTIESFLDYDTEYNRTAGIYELDKTAKHLKEILDDAIDKIVKSQEVKIKF